LLIESSEWPISNRRTHSGSGAGNPAHAAPVQDPLAWQERQSLGALQWLVAIAVSYLIIAVDDRSIAEPLPALLIALSLASAALLRRLPDVLFERHIVEPGLLVVDSLLILSAITTSQQLPWDLVILFFFCVFIAAIGENLIQIGVGCVLLSLAFVMFVSPNGADLSTAQPNFIFRVPFMFGISIFYGYLAGQVKKEQKRAADMEQAAKFRRQMVCAMAHDIKTPLNVIYGYAELLADPSGGFSTPTERKTSLNCIRDNIDRIVKLITDFLDVAKMESSKPQGAANPLELNGVAEEVVQQQSVMAREKHLSLLLRLDADIEPVLGDRDQLQRALGNLVSNAIKFTPPGGRITVSTEMVKKNVALRIKDTGRGIPAGDIPKLFAEFHRLETSEHIEGTGLGLFIVKTIVEAHGGSVAVESEEGLGTIFTILLPAVSTSSTVRQAA